MEVLVLVAISTSSVIALLCVLAALREIVILRGDVHALSQLITTPPEPAIMNAALPRRLANLVYEASSLAGPGARSATHCVVFASEDCGPCRDLLVRLEKAAENYSDLRANVSVVVKVGAGQKSRIEGTLRRAGIQYVRDSGELAKECGVRGTPMTVGVNSATGIVTEYTYGSDEQWIISRSTREERYPVMNLEGRSDEASV